MKINMIIEMQNDFPLQRENVWMFSHNFEN